WRNLGLWIASYSVIINKKVEVFLMSISSLPTQSIGADLDDSPCPHLPKNVVIDILRFLPAKDVGNTVLVCKKWMREASKILFWNSAQLKAEFPLLRIIWGKDWKAVGFSAVEDIPVLERTDLAKLTTFAEYWKNDIIYGVIPKGITLRRIDWLLNERGSKLEFLIKPDIPRDFLDHRFPKTAVIAIASNNQLHSMSPEESLAKFQQPNLLAATAFAVISLLRDKEILFTTQGMICTEKVDEEHLGITAVNYNTDYKIDNVISSQFSRLKGSQLTLK
ncbi:MAG: F-box protein, partial [Verrucomicrobia bacterium]|nr:F-box protein [Verrucomicrobiota bacterium]